MIGPEVYVPVLFVLMIVIGAIWRIQWDTGFTAGTAHTRQFGEESFAMGRKAGHKQALAEIEAAEPPELRHMRAVEAAFEDGVRIQREGMLKQEIDEARHSGMRYARGEVDVDGPVPAAPPAA